MKTSGIILLIMTFKRRFMIYNKNAQTHQVEHVGFGSVIYLVVVRLKFEYLAITDIWDVCCVFLN